MFRTHTGRMWPGMQREHRRRCGRCSTGASHARADGCRRNSPGLPRALRLSGDHHGHDTEQHPLRRRQFSGSARRLPRAGIRLAPATRSGGRLPRCAPGRGPAYNFRQHRRGVDGTVEESAAQYAQHYHPSRRPGPRQRTPPPILAWLKDPQAHFPPQVDGDLVEDGVCVVCDRREARYQPADRQRAPQGTRPGRTRAPQAHQAVDLLPARRGPHPGDQGEESRRCSEETVPPPRPRPAGRLNRSLNGNDVPCQSTTQSTEVDRGPRPSPGVAATAVTPSRDFSPTATHSRHMD